MIWDDINQEWRPRFGFNRAARESDDWVIEDKGDGSESHIDPFQRNKIEKKQRVLKNQLQHIKNIVFNIYLQERAEGKEKKELYPAGIPQTIDDVFLIIYFIEKTYINER